MLSQPRSIPPSIENKVAKMATTTAGELMKAAAHAAQPYPAPKERISLEELKEQLRLYSPTSSTMKQRRFGFFPFLPKEMRDTIWKMAIPTPDVLRILILGCLPSTGLDDDDLAQADNDEEVRGSTTKPLPTFTYTAGIQFYVTECCKEAHYISRNLLPRSLATGSSEPQIRFDPTITGIYIDNLSELLMTVDFDKSYAGEDWVFPESCVGNGITTLVVHEADFWNQWRYDQLDWMNEWRWVGVFRKMFKNVETVVTWNILGTAWTFEEEWKEWEEEEDRDSPPQRRWKVSLDRENSDFYDIDWFERLLNDHLANIVDRLSRDGCFLAGNSNHRKRPHLKIHESADISNSLNCSSLPVRPA